MILLLRSMVKIYQDYDQEPEDVFLPLPDKLGCELYDLEMDQFSEDITFFEKYLPERTAKSTCLELGCGSGRVSRALCSPKREMVGIDLSLEMLTRARNQAKTGSHYLCMDMRQIAFSIQFDAILIPYNTLNLLQNEEDIITCLKICKELLLPGGKIFLHLYIPTTSFQNRPKKTFQFQMFDRPGGGRIIKEILKLYLPEPRKVLIEERYRIRPMQTGQSNEDWNQIYSIAGFDFKTWRSVFKKSDLELLTALSDFTGTSFKLDNAPQLIAILK